jgi:hypothetical protein
MRAPGLGRLLAARASRFVAALALLTAVGVVALIVGGVGSSSPRAAGSSSATSPGSTSVARRDLVHTDTESGTLSYTSPQTVYDRLSGTITWLPNVGQVIKPGQALLKVNGEPVTLLDGTTPAYRDLSSSDSSGQDILELNRNLVRLGFNPGGIVVDGTWQAATTAGVEALQASLGETQTGTLSLGQIAFLPGDQLVSTVNATLGSTGGGSQGNSSSSSNASDPAPTAGPEFASLETHPSQPSSSNNSVGGQKPGASTSSKSLKALIALLEAEIAELKAANKAGNGSHSGSPSNGGNSPSSNGGGSSNHGGSPSSSNGNSSSNRGNSSSNGNSSPNGGSGSGNASAVLQTTSTQLIVTVDLDASKQSEAKVGEPVTVQLPNGSTVEGRITAVSPVAQSSSNSNNGNGSNGNNNNNGSNNNNNNSNGNGSNSGSGSTIPVTIALNGRHAGSGLDRASVSVNFAQAQAKNVLSVPVTALLATGGGGYAVQEAAAPHRLIPVTTGLFAAGYVQISGPGIYSGLEVTDSQG